MNLYLAQIEDVVRAIEIYSPTEFSWFGQRWPRVLESVKQELTLRTARKFLVFSLQDLLYRDFYCSGSASATTQEREATGHISGSRPFLERLSAANSSRGYWENGWQITRVDRSKNVATVRRGALRLIAHEKECQVLDGDTFAPGAMVRLNFPKESGSLSPSFYMAMGNEDLVAGEDDSVVRFYWNVVPDGAVTLVREATAQLNASKIPFRLKVVNNPENYTRCDTAVLYIRKSNYVQAMPLIEQMRTEMQRLMRSSVPALTLKLAPGLALAEDPKQGNSFGMHRCGLLAEGLVAAHESEVRSIAARLEVVASSFHAQHIKITAPYLEAGSTDDYKDHWQILHGANYRSSGPSHINQPIRAKEIEDVAHQISSQLVRDAIWHEDRCNWVGAETVSTQDRGRTARTVYRTLGPDLYSGTAGVALFLAEYAALAGDVSARNTALAAIRQTFSRAESVDRISRISLYNGWPGMGLIGARIGHITGSAETTDQAIRVTLRCATNAAQERHEYDLLSGSAGAIVALLAFFRSTGERSFYNCAVELGADLLYKGIVDRQGDSISWPSVANPKAMPLTGFSHGAAGIGCALLELGNASGDPRYRSAAESAMRYEARWFDPDMNNWMDLRGLTRKGNSAHIHRQPCASFWCHGAPGIALSRLRAVELTGDLEYKQALGTALETTRKSINADLAGGSGNFSLCHGLAGNSLILTQIGANRDSGHIEQSALDLCWQVAEEGLRRYKANSRWDYGTGADIGAQSPGLMLGLAGIGRFYLSLYNSTLPSCLLVRPGEWAFPNTRLS